MAYGLKVFGIHGAEIIDGEYQNHCFHNRIELQLSRKDSFGVALYSAEYQVSVPDPMIFISSPVDTAIIGGMYGHRYHYRFVAKHSAKISVYVFSSKPHKIGNETYGLQVFGKNQSLVFDSRWRLLRLAALHTLQPTEPPVKPLDSNSNGPERSIVLPEGREYAARITVARAYNFLKRGTGKWRVLMEWSADDALRVEGNKVTYRKLGTPSSAPGYDDPIAPEGWMSKGSSMLAIADVTNYR
ncbi:MULTISPECIES: hypothetical protein [Salinivibrio]|uniref:DUF2071 domain-containing protein n=1 Tax=Salinivibrio proteolyticus TaxID=334715 RepID=A0ABY7LBY9_9GAMM|nr:MULTISPECIES: hypothetical protein [Salinivibrio]PCE67529.1 hypothetical protein B6G00_04050 [Salinivibrio sp. YCSC6]QCF35565.1 hypothetical protein E8E00_04900 [Salinivibrio sp. YCSC6]WBA13839.1 hypothetical protein N7E60_08855 [Salinivibrio proteolyticus]